MRVFCLQHAYVKIPLQRIQVYMMCTRSLWSAQLPSRVVLSSVCQAGGCVRMLCDPATTLETFRAFCHSDCFTRLSLRPSQLILVPVLKVGSRQDPTMHPCILMLTLNIKITVASDPPKGRQCL